MGSSSNSAGIDTPNTSASSTRGAVTAPNGNANRYGFAPWAQAATARIRLDDLGDCERRRQEPVIAGLGVVDAVEHRFRVAAITA